MRLFIYISVVLFSSTLMAQGNSKAALFVSNTENSNDILVKWLYSEVYHPSGFDVYRSSGDNEWKKLSNTPVKLNKTASVSNFDEETKQLYKAISQTSHEEFSTSIARAFVLIKAIYNNELAKEIGILYIDKTAESGKKYKYKITKHNETKETAVSEEITCENFSENFEPRDVIIEREKKYISINWKPDVYSYYGVDIYRKEINGADFVKMTNIGPITIDIKTQKKYKTTDVFYADTAVNNEKGYVYKLVSLNYFGQQSRFTEEITVPLKDFVPPATPYSFKVTPYSVDKYARLSWQAVDEADLKGFNVYSSKDAEGTFTKINTSLLDKSTRTYDAKDLTVGGHYFIVSAVDEAENETTTGMMFGELRDVVPPAAPADLTSKAESGTITLSWTPNSEKDLMGYIIQKSLSDSNNLDNKYVQLNKEIITATTFEIKLAKNVQNEFVYRVLALDTLYNISKPSINSMAQMPDVTAPKSPVISKITMDTESQQILVHWISNVDTDLAGYNLYRKTKGDSTFSQVNFRMIPSDVNEYIDRTSEAGNSYIFVVMAVDNSGNVSSNSNEFSFLVSKKKSEARVEVTKSEYNSRKKEINIQWKWTGDDNPKGFVVYLMSEDGILKPFTGLSTGNELKVKHTLEAKRTFEVRAYAANGEIIKSNLFIIEVNNN